MYIRNVAAKKEVAIYSVPSGRLAKLKNFQSPGRGYRSLSNKRCQPAILPKVHKQIMLVALPNISKVFVLLLALRVYRYT